jgi:hypothetical protein
MPVNAPTVKPAERRVKRIVAESHGSFYLHPASNVNAGADALAQAFLEVTLRSRNISIGELADLCGWNLRAFVNQAGAGFPCVPLRWKVERALGFLSIWTPGGEVDLRRRCFTDYGIDPRVAELPELKELCRRLGVQSPNIRRQEEWVSNLMAWLAVHRNPQT